MNIYDSTYRELKRIISLSSVSAKIKKDLLIYENTINKSRMYILREKDTYNTNSIELTEKELFTMISKIMEENQFFTRDNVNDFLQINYSESLEQTLERF